VDLNPDARGVKRHRLHKASQVMLQHAAALFRFDDRESTTEQKDGATLLVSSCLAGPITVTAREPLLMQVAPSVSRAPTMVTARLTVASESDNRAVRVVAESPEFFTSIEVQIDGDHSRSAARPPHGRSEPTRYGIRN
jgi:hypothetical protein